MESLHSNDVWELDEQPQNRKIASGKWIFKRKLDTDRGVKQCNKKLDWLHKGAPKDWP